MLIAEEVTDQIKLGNIKSAHKRCEGLNQKDKLGVWSLLNAKTKLALKKYLEAKKYGGAGGNRTPVRKHSTESSTCLAIVVFV